MRQGTSQNVNRVCKQHSWLVDDSCYISTTSNDASVSVLALHTKVKARTTLLDSPFKNSPVTSYFFIQAKAPKFSLFMGPPCEIIQEGKICAQGLADIENVKSCGKIENFSICPEESHA